jgi:hypothetical protein
MEPAIRARTVLRVLVAVLPWLHGSGTLGASAQPTPASVVEWARSADESFLGDATPAIVLDTTPADVPALAGLLARGTEAQQSAAALALGYGGGDAAIDALRAHATAGTMLGLALGQRGTTADRAELIRALDGPHVGDEWPRIVAAALALGVLRATEAVPALERIATDDGSLVSDAAQDAVRWIRQGTWRVDALPAASDEDRIIAAAFRNGIPRTEEASLFNDDERGGAWIRDGDRWRFRPDARTADAPELGFTVTFNAQRTRAILSVSLVFGQLNGSGYDYVLSREADGWKVRGVMFTWIS